ncbi:MAG: hypothetical protein WD396_11135 [Pseudohongiellaceae bacterium]
MPYAKTIKLTVIVVLAYAALVILFESLLGFFQPEAGNTQVITTFTADGTPHERVVARLESGDSLYVAANHWPRAWYGHVLDDPRMQVTYDGEVAEYRVVPLPGDSEEYRRVNSEHSLPLLFRVLTGFPPRRLVRLDPIR